MKISLEYVWIGGGGEFRSKNKIMRLEKELSLEDIPEWNFDGSSTNQAHGLDTEVILKPVKVVKSPFKLENGMSYLVLCETNLVRENAKQLFDLKLDLNPWFGLEQEYFMTGSTFRNNIHNQGPYYCGVGNGKHSIERLIAMEHLDACLYADLEISGVNAEVAHCQWEYQIGPCVGIDAGDQLLLSRYILERIAEKYKVTIRYDPKPFDPINGSGCHVNFSTEEMRQEGGMEVIHESIHALSLCHDEIISISGFNNERRLTGLHETSSMDQFTYGVGTRHTSVRIPNSVFRDDDDDDDDDEEIAHPGEGYVSAGDLFKLGRVKQFKDLCGYDKQTGKVDEKVFETIQELKGVINNFNRPLYHIIRTNNGYLHDITVQNFKQIFPFCNFLTYDQESDIENINTLLTSNPDNHTFIFIREKLRCAITLEKQHIGVLYERLSKKIMDSTILQGLIGRNTGYDDNGFSTIYTNIDTILKYEKLWESGFKDTAIEWNSNTTKIKNNTTVSKGTFNKPDDTDENSVSSDESDREPHIKKFHTQDEVKEYYDRTLKEIMKGRGPNKRRQNVDEYYEVTIRSITKIYSCDEVYYERKWGLTKENYRCYPCYQDIKDKSTLQWWFIHY